MSRFSFRPKFEPLEDRCLLSFNPVVSYPAGPGPQAVATADFNNDAIPDLAATNPTGNTVSILLGNGGGTFQAARSSATGDSPTSIAVGDFNADGNMDVATGNATNGDISILLGRGDGTFQPPTAYFNGYVPQSLFVGDFNSDGKLDLCVVASNFTPVVDGEGYYDFEAFVLLGTGTGSFSAAESTSLPSAVAVVADFNGDQKLDLAAVSAVGTGVVLFGDGEGTFGSPATIDAGGYVSSLTACDLNRDGHVDLAMSDTGSNALRVLLGNGLGSFASPQTYAAGAGAQFLAAADFDGDGNIDLIATDSNASTVSVLLGTGTGAFELPVTTDVGSYAADLAVGDFNGDGRPDAAVSGPAGVVSVLINDGTWPAPGAPAIAVNDAMVTEGNAGTTSMTFTVTLSAPYGKAVSVHYATADGNASVAGGDYQPASGTLTFAPGETTKPVTVLVNGDRLPEGTESFSLWLTNPTNAFMADAMGEGNILDDEPRIAVIGGGSILEGNSGTKLLTFTVTLGVPYDQPVSVNYTTMDANYFSIEAGATAGEDYVATSGTLTFAPGETTKTINVVIKGDKTKEPNEIFYLHLFGASSNAMVDPWGNDAVGRILNDDGPPPKR
jgi:hypothetical protein